MYPKLLSIPFFLMSIFGSQAATISVDSGCDGRLNQNVEWRTYSSSEMGLTLSYPAYWTVIQRSPENKRWLAFFKTKGICFSIARWVRNPADSIDKSSDIIAHEKERSQMRGDSVFNVEKVVINGDTCSKITEFPRVGRYEGEEYVICPKSTASIEITYFKPLEYAYACISIIDKMLLSIRFLGSAASPYNARHNCQDEPLLLMKGKDTLREPAFSLYPVTQDAPLKIAPLDLKSSPLAQRYCTVIRNQLKQGPNFAGHYAVVSWGCGSCCFEFAIVDTRNGKVLSGPGDTEISTCSMEDGFYRIGLHHCLKSRLLIVVGKTEEDSTNTTRFYLLDHERLKLLSKIDNCDDQIQ
jgi:hypothetical protein